MRTRIVCAIAKPCFRVMLVRYRDRARSRQATVGMAAHRDRSRHPRTRRRSRRGHAAAGRARARGGGSARLRRLGVDPDPRERRGDAGARRGGPRGARDCRGQNHVDGRAAFRSAPRRRVDRRRPRAQRHDRVRRSDPLAERGRAIGLVLAALLAPENRARLERAKTAHADVAPAGHVASAPPPPRRHATSRSMPRQRPASPWAARIGAGGAIGLRWQPGSRFGLQGGRASPLRRGRCRRGRRPISGRRRAWSCSSIPPAESTTLRPRAARRRDLALRVAIPPVAG